MLIPLGVLGSGKADKFVYFVSPRRKRGNEKGCSFRGS